MGLALVLPASVQGLLPTEGVACCRSLADAFLRGGAQRLVLQPAGVWHPVLLVPARDGSEAGGRGWPGLQTHHGDSSARFDEVAASTAAHAYLAAARQYAAAVQQLQFAGWLRSWQVDRHSAAPAECDVAAAAAAARSIVMFPVDCTDLLKLLPGSLTAAQRRQVAVVAPIRLWSMALGAVAGAQLVRLAP